MSEIILKDHKTQLQKKRKQKRNIFAVFQTCSFSDLFVTGSVGRGRTKISVESSGMEEEDENEADDEEEEDMDQDEDDDDDDDDNGDNNGDGAEKEVAITLMVEGGVVPINGRYM